MKVAVVGAAGRMGGAVCAAVSASTDMQLVASLDAGDKITPDTLHQAQAVVEFTHPQCSKDNTEAILRAGAHAVVGTTGWDQTAYEKITKIATETGKNCFIAPNFAMSAVLVMEFSKYAARFFESVEITETHHPQKLDAPSGTAIATAEQIAQVRAQAGLGDCPDATRSALPGARGAQVQQVPIHSLRVSGATAHQEVIFGNPGEQLRLRTDCFGQQSFMPGVLLALRNVHKYPGLTVGLDKILQLQGGV